MVISWFSCGATSAIATKLALSLYDDVKVFYIDTGGEHPDNIRFLRDCEAWFGITIHVVRSDEWVNPLDVFRRKRYFGSAFGAPCTLVLKKRVRWAIEAAFPEFRYQVFGFDALEEKRFIRFREQYPTARAVAPLIRHGLSKSDCLALLLKAGIDLPVMYRLGFSNNNCIGCVKGGKGYWANIRRCFPDIFREYASLERELGYSIIKDCYLDNLGDYPVSGIVPSCSLFCNPDFMDV